MRDEDFEQIGFWSGCGKENDKFPKVRSSTSRGWSEGKHQYLERLAKVEAKASARRFKGDSTCRICGNRNGSSTFYYKGWCWPSGFSHYIRKHNIKPSGEFLLFLAIHGA
jgi:hypothetical protein